MTMIRHTAEEAESRKENLRTRLVKENLKGQTWARVEAEAGVGDGTIRKFAGGTTNTPSLVTLLKLSAVTTRRAA